MYPTHNPDGTCTKEYFQAVRAVNFVRDTGHSWEIDPNWSSDFVRIWTLHVKNLANNRGYIAVIAGSTLILMTEEDFDASRANR